MKVTFDETLNTNYTTLEMAGQTEMLAIFI